jgi:hypothetical protein
LPRYDAYLLRIWRAEPGDPARWAGRLEHLPDGHFERFSSLEALLAHLQRLLAEEGNGPTAAGMAAGHETPLAD